MCKTCGFTEHINCATSSITSYFYTAFSLKINGLRTSASCTSTCTLSHTGFVNTVFSYISSVIKELSTVSTVPTITSAQVKFKFIYNN